MKNVYGKQLSIILYFNKTKTYVLRTKWHANSKHSTTDRIKHLHEFLFHKQNAQLFEKLSMYKLKI